MSFLQSQSWQAFQESLGRKTWRIEHGSISALVIELDLPLRQRYLYVPRGPNMDFNKGQGGFRNDIEFFYRKCLEIGRERKSVFLKIEPELDNVMQLIFQEDLKKSNREIQPMKTVIMDLSKTESDILSGMHHKTRYNIQLAKKHGVEIRQGEDIDAFLKLLKQTTKHNQFHAHTDSYYRSLLNFFSDNKECSVSLYLAYQNEKPLAGAIFLGHNGTVHYLHGAMDRRYKNLMAPYALHWEVMKAYAGIGYSQYDFWGIDERAWPGVTRFKLGWGGQIKEYPGSFDLSFSRFKYKVLSLIRKARG